MLPLGTRKYRMVMIGVQIRVVEPVPDRGENVLPSGGDVGNRSLTLQFPEEILEVAVKIQMNRRNILCPGRIRGPGIFGQSVLPAPAGEALPENGGKSSKNGFVCHSARSFRGLGRGVLEVAMVRVVTFSNRFIARAASPRMSP